MKPTHLPKADEAKIFAQSEVDAMVLYDSKLKPTGRQRTPPDPLVRRPGGLGRVGDNEMPQRVHSRKVVHRKVYSAILGDAKILRKHVMLPIQVLPILGGRGGFAAQWPRIPAEPDESQLETGNKRGAGRPSPLSCKQCCFDSGWNCGGTAWRAVRCLELCKASIHVYHQPAGM